MLEAGARFTDDDLPENGGDAKRFIFQPELGMYGIQRIDIVNDCFILAGAGVGGGSLVYANTLYEPLDPFYRTRSGRTSPTGSPSSRPTTTRPSGCWA